MRRWSWALVAFFAGCNGEPAGGVDDDLDGYAAADDCDDNNANANPEQTEVCDGADNNCDGTVDEGLTTTWFKDDDGDGEGDPNKPIEACGPGPGRTVAALATDCDDSNPLIAASKKEICDGLNNDCDTETDEGVLLEFFKDQDDDGHGDPLNTALACEAGNGLVESSDDCNDLDPDSFPGALETCDGKDNDCDTFKDEAGAAGEKNWYKDGDSDGQGTPSVVKVACDAPAGFVAKDTDCNDDDNGIYEGAPEYCDGKNNDCDSQTDEDVVDPETWYFDVDGDSYGNSDDTLSQCAKPAGTWVAIGGDCNVVDNTVYPGAPELCDNVDNDCDTVKDNDPVEGNVWHPDVDEDSFGDSAESVRVCANLSGPEGWLLDGTDCDDADPQSHPGADELCGDGDQNCDELGDDGAIDALSWYTDTDGDDRGLAGSEATLSCEAPGADWALNDVDCDDENVDVGGTLSYRDVDEDGDGDPADEVEWCLEAPVGYVENDDDCDDEDPALNAATVWYPDLDVDGYGVSDGSEKTQCAKPGPLWALRGAGAESDCEATNSNVSPGTQETCLKPSGEKHGLDDNCDGIADEPAQCPIFVCDDITTDTTWAAHPHGYQVICEMKVGAGGGATLTIEDGTTVRFANGRSLSVGTVADGTLVVQGTEQGVVFESGKATVAAGDWDGLALGPFSSASSLTGLEVRHGGGSLQVGAGLLLDRSDAALTDVTVSRSARAGVRTVQSESVLTGVTVVDNVTTGLVCSVAPCWGELSGLTATTNGAWPLSVPWNAVGAAAAVTGDLTGNVVDLIEVPGGTITEDTTWPLTPLALELSKDLVVEGTSSPTLTLAEGSVVYALPGISVDVGRSKEGGLDLSGMATFTSRLEEAGSWEGLYVGPLDDNLDIEGLEVHFAGAFRPALTLDTVEGLIGGIAIVEAADLGLLVDSPQTDVSGVTISSTGDGAQFLSHAGAVEDLSVDAAGIAVELVDSDGAFVDGLELTGECDVGIQVSGGDFAVYNSTISGARVGLRAIGAGSLSVSEVSLSGNTVGLEMDSGSVVGDDLTVSLNSDFGLDLGAGVSGFDVVGLVVSLNGQPAKVHPAALGHLPPGSWTGNILDRVEITDGTLGECDVPELGVSWGIGDLTVGGGTATFPAGASVVVRDGGQLRVGTLGAGILDAQGVSFDSESATPGSWCGIVLGQDSEGSILDGSTVRNGGSGECGLYLGNVHAVSTDVSLLGLTSEGSGAHGVVLESSGADLSGSFLRNNVGFGLLLLTPSGDEVYDGVTFENNGSGDVGTL